MISFTTGVFAEQTVQAFNLDNKLAQLLCHLNIYFCLDLYWFGTSEAKFD